MKIIGKTALVTGANRGIGFAIVNALLDSGVKKVYATARDISSMPDFEDPRVELLQLDINNAEQIDRAVKSASDIDLLINNAGVAAFTSLLDGPRESLSRDMQTNYFGTLDMIRSFVPILENRNERLP